MTSSRRTPSGLPRRTRHAFDDSPSPSARPIRNGVVSHTHKCNYFVAIRQVGLTTITTVVGLLPLAYGIGGSDKFLRPSVLALGYGLLFATVLTLIFVPCVYLIRVDIGRFLLRLTGRSSPAV